MSPNESFTVSSTLDILNEEKATYTKIDTDQITISANHLTDRKPSASEILYHRLIVEAPLIPVKELPTVDNNNGDTTDSKGSQLSNSSLILPDWVNPELVNEGKKFVRRNFFAIIFAHLVALAFLLCVKPIQALLLRTGAIHDRETSLKKYLLTILRVKRWYESDLLDQSSKAAKDIFSVRKVQRNAAKNFHVYVPPPTYQLKLNDDEDKLLTALREDLKSVEADPKNKPKIYTTVNPDVPLSQYDLAIIQFAFFGFVALFPKVFGIHETRKKHAKGMEGFVHIWALLGSLLGLEDSYNLCIPYHYCEQTNEKIFQEVFLFSFCMCDNKAVRLWKAMTAGSSRYFFFFRTKSLLCFMEKNVARVASSKNLHTLMNWWEKFCYFAYVFTLRWVIRCSLTRLLLNFSSRLVFSWSNWVLIKYAKKDARYDSFIDLRVKNDDVYVIPDGLKVYS